MIIIIIIIIRVTVLLEYIDRALFICGCILLYNSLMFDPILLSLGNSCLLWLVHLSSNFQLILHCGLSDTGGNFHFFITQNRSHDSYQCWVRLHISLVSYSIDF